MKINRFTKEDEKSKRVNRKGKDPDIKQELKKGNIVTIIEDSLTDYW